MMNMRGRGKKVGLGRGMGNNFEEAQEKAEDIPGMDEHSEDVQDKMSDIPGGEEVDEIQERRDELSEAGEQLEEAQDKMSDMSGGEQIDELQERGEDVPGGEQIDELQEKGDDVPLENPSEEVESKIESVKEDISEEELRCVFDEIDESGNGILDPTELEKGMQLLGMNPDCEEVQKTIDEIDTEGDGLDFEEFKRLMKSKGRESVDCQTERLRDAFNTFDEDRSGNLDVGEFKNCMMECGDRMSEDEVQDLIKQMNPAAEDKINFGEFISFFTSNLRMPAKD